MIGLIAALAVPEFAGAIQKIRWHSMSSNMVSSLRLARSSAIAQQSQYGVDFDRDGRKIIVFKDLINKASFTFDNGDSVVSIDTISAELDYLFVTPSDRAICFFPNGRAADWAYVMGSRYCDEMYQTVNISVLPATGRVSVEYLEN
jgi:Tfp pilus assembly protein FimT